jgi:hypothetical protein
MKDTTFKFQIHSDNEYGRDIPGSMFYVIATSLEEARNKSLEYIKTLNAFEQMKTSFPKEFYTRCVHVDTLSFLSPIAINYEPQ